MDVYGVPTTDPSTFTLQNHGITDGKILPYFLLMTRYFRPQSKQS